MSLTRKVPVPCADCHAVSDVTIWQSANVTLDPEAKTELLEDRLNTFVCGCGVKHVLPVPFMYHDMDQRYAIILTYPEEPAELTAMIAELNPDQLPGYRLRVVTSRNALREKIYAFDDDLDDRILEVVKVMVVKAVLGRSGERVREIRYTPLRQTAERLMRFWLVLEDKPRPVIHTISREILYDELLAVGASHFSRPGGSRHEWMTVDQAYGIRLGTKLGALSSEPGQ